MNKARIMVYHVVNGWMRFNAPETFEMGWTVDKSGALNVYHFKPLDVNCVYTEVIHTFASGNWEEVKYDV